LAAVAGAAVSLVVVAAMGVSCAFKPPRMGSIARAERLAAVPTKVDGAYGPIAIYWSEHQVPFIEAADDRDVPYAMGVVHAHLRLGQMEVLRRISQGRIAESAGPIPVVVDIDHALRTIDFGKAAAAIEAQMRPDTREWVERYVEGVNDARRAQAKRPLEYRILGADDEPWTVRDVITLGRLASTDINWLGIVSHLSLSSSPHWETVRARVRGFHGMGTPSFGPDVASPALDLATMVGKTGSNSFAVAGARTASGKPILANDPHVGFALPALWCIVGYKSPSHHVAGMTIAGLPFVVLGRNDRIAWGGTNMQGVSTSVFDVSGLGEDEIRSREVEIGRRLWFGATRTVRETQWGPVLTDVPLIGEGWKGPMLALKWRGHEVSDEFSAFKDASHARNWEEFRAAWKPFAVSGQNMLYADAEGNIGQVMALEYQPWAGAAAVGERGPVASRDEPRHAWGRGIPSTELPWALNPEEGVLVSTNNTPVRLDPPAVVQGNSNDRQDRIVALVKEGPVDRARASAIQRDVYSAASHGLARAVVARAKGLDGGGAGGARAGGAGVGGAGEVLADLEAWDGHYRADSRGALVLQAVTEALITRVYGAMYDARMAEYLMDSSAAYDLLREDVEAGHADVYLAGALAEAAREAEAGKVWGDVHRLAYRHFFGQAPVVGSWYTFGDVPVDGSLTTVFKTAAPIGVEKHTTRFGANARQIIDLSDPDAHWIALMGGQDGWMGSENFLDMVPMWRSGELVRVPMTLEAVRAGAVATTRIEPVAGGGK
jgi:penicillin amidase